MKTIWLTYAWADNSDGDIDFIAQELVRSGVSIKLDRWNIGAGGRLWEQIASQIEDPAKSDGWMLFASQASLGSEPCREEFAIALDRALSSRGANFPIIGLFNGTVDTSLVPASVRARLCVSTADPDWKERIRAAAEGQLPSVSKQAMEPHQVRIHQRSGANGEGYAIEIRPRAGTWSPFFAGVSSGEKDSVKPTIMHGPSNRVPMGSVLHMVGDGPSDDGKWHMMFAQNEATPTQSYYLFVSEIPTQIIFGVHNSQPRYLVQLKA
jgi:hypothetical protein